VQHRMRSKPDGSGGCCGRGAAGSIEGRPGEMPSDVMAALADVVAEEGLLGKEDAVVWVKSLRRVGRMYVECWSSTSRLSNTVQYSVCTGGGAGVEGSFRRRKRSIAAVGHPETGTTSEAIGRPSLFPSSAPWGTAPGGGSHHLQRRAVSR